jgi:hypothetical protein
VRQMRTDLIEDYSHIRLLGEALSSSKIHTCGLANCEFNSATLTTFVESVAWATAVLTSVNWAIFVLEREHRQGGVAWPGGEQGNALHLGASQAGDRSNECRSHWCSLSTAIMALNSLPLALAPPS